MKTVFINYDQTFNPYTQLPPDVKALDMHLLMSIETLAASLSKKEVASFLTIDLIKLSPIEAHYFNTAWTRGRLSAISYAVNVLKESDPLSYLGILDANITWLGSDEDYEGEENG